MRPFAITNLALALVWLLFFRYCQNNSYHDPSTLFYDSTRAYTQQYSAIRETEALDFVHKAVSTSATAAKPDIYLNGAKPSGNKDSVNNGKQPEGVKLCVGIPSILRDRENFIDKTIASLVDTLSLEERKRLNLKVLLGENDPRIHPGFGQDWLKHIADEVIVYGDEQPDDLGYHHISNSSMRWLPDDLRNKRVQLDYANLMGACRDQGADYFVLIEDDVIASRDWFKRLTRSIEEVEARSNGKEDWLYIRLFYTETYLGWNSEEWHVYLGNSILLFSIVAGAVLLVRWRSPAMRQLKATDLVRANSGLVFLIAAWMAAYIALYFMAGRLLVSPYAVGVHEMPQYGCCAQGLAMPYRNLEPLERALREPPHDIAGDSFIDMIADRDRLKKWVMVPSVLQHIGIRCSSEKGYLKTTWNFSFEKGPWPLR